MMGSKWHQLTGDWISCRRNDKSAAADEPLPQRRTTSKEDVDMEDMANAPLLAHQKCKNELNPLKKEMVSTKQLMEQTQPRNR